MYAQPPDQLDSLPSPDRPTGTRRDRLVICMLALIVALLVTAWIRSGRAGEWVIDDEGVTRFSAAALGLELVDLMLGYWVLPALGFALVLHRGSVDLSVWMCFTLSSAVAAALLASGATPLAALGAVVTVGLAVGAFNAIATAWLRVPSAMVTLISAGVCFGLAYLVTGTEAIKVPAESLSVWAVPHWPRRLTAGFYIIAMLLALLIVRRRWGFKHHARVSLAAAMIGSGVLAALGGLCLIARLEEAPSPTWRLIDPLILAAGALAGAACLRGPRRTLLVGLLTPVALLAATMWEELVCDLRDAPIAVNVLALAALAWGAQWAFVRSEGAPALRRPAVIALTIGGVGAIAAMAIVGARPDRLDDAAKAAIRTISGLGAAAWFAGVGLALVRRAKS